MILHPKTYVTVRVDEIRWAAPPVVNSIEKRLYAMKIWRGFR